MVSKRSVELRHAGVTAKIIIVSMYGDPRVAKQAIAAGASAFVAKQGAGEELLTAIRMVLKGGTYISPHIAERMARRASPNGRSRH